MTLSINSSRNEAEKSWDFKLVGEMDISNAHDFRKQIDEALAREKRNITIDCSELNYMDSTGLGVIIGAYGAIKKDGFCVRVNAPKDNIKKLLNISGLDKILC